MSCEVEDYVCKGNGNECVCTECADKGRGMYLANPTLCRDSKFHHWNSSPQLNSTPPRSVPTRSVQHADTLHNSSCPASTSFRNAYGTRKSYFVVSTKLTARAVRPAISTNFCSLFLNCCPYLFKKIEFAMIERWLWRRDCVLLILILP